MGSTVKESDARAAYSALVDFAQVVKANPITPSTPASSVSGSSIAAAADKLSAAAYPFIKDHDGRGHGWRLPEGGRERAREGHRGHGREGRAVAVRFLGHQHGPREGDRIGAD